MFTALYILIGYFFAAGVVCAPLYFKSHLASTKFAAYTTVSVRFVWTMLFVGAVVWILWLPLVLLAIFIGAWVVIFGWVKKHIHIKTAAEIAEEDTAGG